MNEEIMNPEVTGMIVNEKMKADLLSAKKWANFLLSIRTLGVVGLVAYAILMFSMSRFLFKAIPNTEGVGIFMGIFFLVMAAVMVYLIIKGFQFVYGIEEACYTNNESAAARGFAGMRSWLRCVGIVTIVFISIFILFIIIGIIAK